MTARRIAPLLDLARNRENAAAMELTAKTRDLSLHEQRLAELRSYADEYGPASEGFINPSLLLNRLAFRERIDHAVAEEVRTVASSRENCDIERTRLMLASRNTKVLENLSASYRQEELRHERKKEQSQMDEVAMRGTLLRQQSGDTQ
jgi:flagellar FliJ protein